LPYQDGEGHQDFREEVVVNVNTFT
jgi:hypothetical protein